MRTNVFKATSVEIMSVPPLIVWFLSTVEYELVLLGEDLDWLSCLRGVLSIENDHWTSIYSNEWHNFPLILLGTYQTSIICERYFIQAAKKGILRMIFLHINGTRFRPDLIFRPFGTVPAWECIGDVKGLKILFGCLFFKVRTFFFGTPGKLFFLTYPSPLDERTP